LINPQTRQPMGKVSITTPIEVVGYPVKLIKKKAVES
jgi:hypothetical protein